jgi:reactive intermediate/imine deaminase
VARQSIQTEAAPRAIGSYSQAIRSGQTVYLSGQIPLDPSTMELVEGSFEQQLERVFENLKAVASAAGGSLADVLKLTIYVTDLANFPQVNEVMPRFFKEPFPARAVVGAAQLPLGVPVEIEAILEIGSSTDSN